MGQRIAASCLTAVAALWAGAAAAQTTPPGELEAVDPAVADVGPLSASLREMRIDLRSPFGFERVYRVPGSDTLLMRIDGGLHAVFPRSVYIDSRFGPMPQIPHDTVFYIGAPPPAALVTGEALGPAGWRDPHGRWLDSRVDSAPIQAEPVPGPGDAPAANPARRPGRLARPAEALNGPGPPIIADRDYRARRVRDLLRRAAQAARREAP